MTYSEPPPMTIDTDKEYTATIETAKGNLVLELFATDVPVTVNNFVFLARDGYYDNTTFHRVIPDFMAQGGDPTGTGSGGPGYDMDGALDPGAELVASGDGLNLYADFDGTSLYVATQGVGSTGSLDHFLLVDDDPSGSRGAPWAKSGTVAGWDYLLGNENGDS